MRQVTQISGIEVISHTPEGAACAVPLLVVHGAFAGAWCWDEHFLPYFAQHGYTAHALSLRGHGASAGRETLALASIDDYVADMLLAAGQLGWARPPVLIGHSMGGSVVQRSLKRSSAPAAVLMAPVPPQGLAGSALLLAAREPELFQELSLVQHAHPRYATLEALRKAVFSGNALEDEVRGHFLRMQPESQRAMFDLAWPQYFWIGAVNVPVMVLGAERDTFFPPPMIEATAQVYGVAAEIFPDMAHAMMLESDWRKVADRMLEWLEQLRN